MPGRVKATYGTGVFVLAHVGEEVPEPAGGLLPTVAWTIDGRTEYALDGGVFAAGAMLEWLCRELGLADDPPALGALAREADDSGGRAGAARRSPGLGAPWWRPDARAVLAGTHGGTTRAQVARAALEGIAWRVADVVEAIRESVEVDSLRVDGGLTNEPLMLELQADAIGAPVEAAGADATVLGAAALAAVGAGMIGSLAEAAELLPVDRTRRADARRRLARRRARALARVRAGDRRARPALGGPSAAGYACRVAPSAAAPAAVAARPASPRRCPCPRRTRSAGSGLCSACSCPAPRRARRRAERRRRPAACS